MRVLKSIFHIPSIEFKKTFCWLTEKIKLLANKIFRIFSKSNSDNNSVKVKNNVTVRSSSTSSSLPLRNKLKGTPDQKNTAEEESIEKKNFKDCNTKVSNGSSQTSAFTTMSSTIRESDYLGRNSIVNKFLKSDKYPKEFINLIRSYLLVGWARIISKSLTVPNILLFSHKTLGEIADFYNSKYHINMSTCLDNNLLSVLQRWKSENAFTPRGIIVLNHKIVGHVTPIIVNKTSNKMEVLTLDVLSMPSETMPTFYNTINACKDLNIECLCSKKVRQASNFGCDTGAVTVLRNALIDLSQKNQSNQTLQDILGQSLKSENIYNYSVKTVSDLPVTWTYCDQIFPKNADKSLSIPRDNFSKKDCLVKKTVDSFRRSHTHSCTYEYTLELPYYKFNENFKEFITNNRDDLNKSYPLEVKLVGEDLQIKWEEVKEQNIYIQKKGFKFAKKFAPANLKQDLDI